MLARPQNLGVTGSLPRTLAGFHHFHAGETIVVCGCGASLNELESPERFVTIGVNDVGRSFDPTYLVVLNPRNQFKGNRFRYVETSRARAIFTQLDLGIRHPHIVRFRLGKRGGTDFSDPNVLHYTRNSPYVALCLAIHVGAKRIGLVGVDFTDNHFFAQTGRHVLAGQLAQIDREYAALARACRDAGVEIFNLSQESRLKAFPKVPLEAFADPVGVRSTACKRPQPLKIVSYATTPVAGVPAILARCIDARTPHTGRCVWARDGYGNGVVFDGDIQWEDSEAEAGAALAAADLVIVHNGKVDARHRSLLATKLIVVMAHNYMWNVDDAFVRQGWPGVVVGQYQATLPEFADWEVVPNPIPLWEKLFQPGEKSSEITICYTPSGRHERYPRSHRLYWHAKGYDTTMRLLDRLSACFPLRLEVIRDRQVAHSEALSMKRRAHIVIDECVTGGYHRNSLEGLAAGCVVVNGVGSLSGVVQAFERCAGHGNAMPFVRASLDDLERVLVDLIESGREALMKQGAANRAWMEKHWDFARHWERLWMPVVQRASRPRDAGSAGRVRKADTNARAQTSGSSSTRNLSASTGSIGRTPGAARVDPSEKGAVTRSSIPVYWTCRGSTRGNFGDMLSPLIVQALSGRPTHFADKGPRLFAVGSLLKATRRGDLVWGSGFIGADDACARGIRVHAVRGPLTRRKLLQLGIECPEVYGDPALLLPWLYRPPSSRRCGIGIIPHYVDAARVRATVRDPAVRVIDIRGGIEEVLRQANRCEVLLSSSLHGCIVGDAYGIPTVWVRISDKVVGGGFKFRDYYAATAREPVCVDWRREIDMHAAEDAAVRAPPPELDLEPLLLSFPYRHSTIRSLHDLPGQDLDAASENEADRSSRGDRAVATNSRERAPERKSGAARDQSLPTTASADGDPHTEGNRDLRLAVFSAGTESYAAYMATSLRSFMQRNEGRPFDYYVFGHAFSARSRALLQRYGIGYLDLDLNAVFPRRQRDRYPSECFWIFKGPQIFHGMGYAYSLSIDGDTWCNRRLDLDWLPQVSHLAGIDRGGTVGDFLSGLGQYRQLKAHFEIPMISDQRIATNTGVLFYNNAALADRGFFDRLVEVYARSEGAGITRGGDDSTLALLLALYPDIELYVLDELWNAYRGMYRRFSPHDPAYDRHLANWIDDARIVHHSRIKPWDRVTRFPNRVTRHFIELWRDLWLDTVRPHAQQPATPVRPARAARPNPRAATRRRGRTSGRAFPALCYWYRGTKPNVGDETAPYLIKKIAGLSPQIQLRQRPRDPRELSEPVLLSVGSVLRLCGGNTVVWGSGIRNIDQPVADARRFCAVRGPLTRRRLLQLGYHCPETYGDPALLLPRYFRPSVSKRHALGIIAHLLDYPLLSKLYGHHRDVLVIDVATTDIESIVQQVSSCDRTVSSALHGLVISIAYDIRTRWLRCSDKVMGDDTKFYDFFASLNPAVEEALDPTSVTLPGRDAAMEPYRPIRMEGDAIPPHELADLTFSHDVTVDLEQLLKACPIDGSGWKPGVLEANNSKRVSI